ncbi:hypothetical protein LTR84_012065 [Exophiala bonariae]|uniref:Uncharacterized protein n=1 Tax=Exophiala bonariae TaxID=1690606 RepID=A0AAV9NFI5_9EURO|nr:hypothetical protein LTR84_012065 [Exophiala bonariae]
MARTVSLRLILASIASLLIFSLPASGGDVANAAAQAVPNVIPGATVDLGKVDKVRDLLENQVQKPTTDILIENTSRWNEIFNSHINWINIIHGGGGPLSALCSDRCKRCASGCNPICCQVGGTVITGLRPDTPPGGGDSRVQSLLPPLACPCHCEADCPAWIQSNCCSASTADSDDTRRRTPDVERVAARAGAVVQNILGLSDKKVPWTPEACPCTCEVDCPEYVQSNCCKTKGPRGRPKPVPGGNDDALPQPPAPKPTLPSHLPPPPENVLSLVTESRTGAPLSVWARINLTVFDSFITMDLVNGLQRAAELTQNEETGAAELALNVVVGPKADRKAYAQSFQVVDGSDLAEKEQILVGLGFMNRIGAVKVNADFLTGLDDGLPLLTGTIDADDVVDAPRPGFSRDEL